jgi:Ca2+-binding EF-hand superfamily protein
MSTLKEVWQQLNTETVDRENFSKFLGMLSIKLKDEEITKIFTMLDVEKRGCLFYDDIRMFFNMTKVYDKSKYPKAVKRKSSYKIHPEK